MTQTPKFDYIKFLQDIVKIVSCDPPGGELEVAKVVYSTLKSLGIEAQLDEFAPNRANVIGRIRGTGERPNFVFSSHMDTMPPGAGAWEHDPFSGKIIGDRLHGRGATDMKSALSAMVAAVHNLKNEPLKGDVILAFTAGESNNLLGARRFIEQGFNQEFGAFLCGEPSNLDLIIAEKASLWLRFVSTGRIGHVSGDPGINAIDQMNAFLTRLNTLTIDEPEHELLSSATVRVGTIRGGSAVNMTPDECVAEVDIRYRPGVDYRDIIKQVEGQIEGDIRIELIDNKPAVERKPDDPFVVLCQQVCEKYTKNVAVKGVSYYSDSSVLLEDLPIPFAIIGPGELGLSGQINEWVSIEQVHLAVKIYTDIAREYLT